MFDTVIPTPAAKLAHTAALETRFQYNPYKNGARNAPASAPQEIPISCAIKVGGSNAIATESTMKNTISTCIVRTCFFSLIFFITLSFKKSSVSVELDVSTSDASVDMDADKTSTITIPIRMSGNVDSIYGTILSKTTFPVSS